MQRIVDKYFSNYFRKIDKQKTGLLTDIEFRAVLESYFESNFTDHQFEKFLKTVSKLHGKIKYLEFMSKFDINR